MTGSVSVSRESGNFNADAGLTAIFAPADAPKFQQILLNLLSNAIKFTRAGGEITGRGACMKVGTSAV